MIEQVDARLKDWLGSVLAGVPVSFAMPSDTQTGQGINLFLLEIVSSLQAGNARRLPLQIGLRYLVTTWADDEEGAHHLLGMVIFAAMENPDVQVELGLMPVEAWHAFGVKPRPSFVVRTSLQLQRPELPPKLVRKPLVVKTALVTSLGGVVLTPDEVPLVGAQVRLPMLDLTNRTDVNGRFSFAAVPVEPHTKRIVVTAKGSEQEFDVEQPGSDSEPVIIHFDIKED